jgi:hypothetical protein
MGVIKKLTIATGLIVATTAASLSDDFAELMDGPKMRFPNRFQYALSRAPGAPYFQCHLVSKTCTRGIAYKSRSISRFVGVILAEDKKTILAHISCDGTTCFNYDTGAISSSTAPGLDWAQE